MPAWHDPEEWRALLSGGACPICIQGKPTGVVAELESCYATVDEATKVRGYCCLVAKRHAVELHDLTAEEATGLMRDVQRVSRALQAITGAVKLNYEVHGNTIPHMHVHMIPRYRGDELETPGKTLGTLVGQPYKPTEFARFAEDLRGALLKEPSV